MIEAALAATLPPRLQQAARRRCVQRDLDEVDATAAAAAPSASTTSALTGIAFNRGLVASDGTAAEEGCHAAEMRTRAVTRNAISEETDMLEGGERPAKRFFSRF